MKVKVKQWVEIDVYAIELQLAVRYDEEDIPNDFPLRVGDLWKATIEIDTGKILNWPDDPRFLECSLRMKVCDEGTYMLLRGDGSVIAMRESEYVPHGIVPGEYGDYVHLDIKSGIVTNWPRKPCVTVFFESKE